MRKELQAKTLNLGPTGVDMQRDTFSVADGSDVLERVWIEVGHDVALALCKTVHHLPANKMVYCLDAKRMVFAYTYDDEGYVIAFKE